MPAALVLLIFILVVLLLHVLVFEFIGVRSDLLRLFNDVEESVVFGDCGCNGCRHCLFIVLWLFALITLCQVCRHCTQYCGFFRLLFAGHDHILLLVWTALNRGDFILALFLDFFLISLNRLKIRFYDELLTLFLDQFFVLPRVFVEFDGLVFEQLRLESPNQAVPASEHVWTAVDVCDSVVLDVLLNDLVDAKAGLEVLFYLGLQSFDVRMQKSAKLLGLILLNNLIISLLVGVFGLHLNIGGLLRAGFNGLFGLRGYDGLFLVSILRLLFLRRAKIERLRCLFRLIVLDDGLCSGLALAASGALLAGLALLRLGSLARWLLRGGRLLLGSLYLLLDFLVLLGG